MEARQPRVCDFCSAEEPHWLFRCRNFHMIDIIPNPLSPSESIGGWLACHACAPFIQRSDWDGLARRAVAGDGLNPTIRAAVKIMGAGFVMASLKSSWRQFGRHRVGVPIEWKESP